MVAMPLRPMISRITIRPSNTCPDRSWGSVEGSMPPWTAGTFLQQPTPTNGGTGLVAAPRIALPAWFRIMSSITFGPPLSPDDENAAGCACDQVPDCLSMHQASQSLPD